LANKTEGGTFPLDLHPEAYAKMALERTGVPFTEERKENIRIAAFLRDKPNDETKNKMSLSQKDRFKNESSEQKATRILNMSKAQRGTLKIRASCIYCRLESSVNNITKYHGDLCLDHPLLGQKNKKDRQDFGIESKNTCIHCGLKGAPNNLKRYHQDNCLEHSDLKIRERNRIKRRQSGKDDKLTCGHCKFRGRAHIVELKHLENCPHHSLKN